MAHGRRRSPDGQVTFKQRGAKYGREMQDRVRQWLIDRKALERLLDHYEGKVELSPTQTSIGLKVFDKLVPNLQSVEQEITQTTPFAVIPQPAKDKKAWESTHSPALKPGPGSAKPADTKH